MRFLPLVVLLSLFLPQTAFTAGPFSIYLPSRESKSLWVIRAEPEKGDLKLAVVQKIPFDTPIRTIVAHPTKPLLYVADAQNKEGGVPGAVVTLDDTGRFRDSTPNTFAHGYSYLSLDRKQRFLLGANYFAGFVDVYSLDTNGQIDKHVTALNEGRRNAHSILPSPNNRFAYVPYVKDTNAIFQYRFNEGTGALTPFEPKNANPPEGTGPRHIAYHPTKPIVYFSNEQHLGVSVYDQSDSGALTIRQVCKAVGEDFDKTGVSASDVEITSDGKFLFTGIRGHKKDFDYISRYRIKSDGELEHLGLTPAGKIPWGLAFSPDGHYLLVTATKAGTLSAYHIGTDGSLTKKASLPIDKNISDLVSRTIAHPQ